MKNYFYMGGPEFMGALTILLIITTAWIIYHFVVAYKSKQVNHEKLLRKIGYGKSMGLFTLAVGFLGQLIGLINMFSVLKDHPDIETEKTYGAIYVTMMSPIYGILIYLFSLLLWFITSLIIENKNQIK